MGDGPKVETGIDHQNVAIMPGHYEDVTSPVTCLCCGLQHFYVTGPGLVWGKQGLENHLCIYGDRWIQDELGRVACEYHLVEKMKDGLFGALSGDFSVEGKRPTYKRPDERATTPIVHR